VLGTCVESYSRLRLVVRGIKLLGISRKAPAFLQGLLQFDFSLVEPAGLEPATSCLQIM